MTRQSVLYVVLNVRVRAMCCGNVLLNYKDSRDIFIIKT